MTTPPQWTDYRAQLARVTAHIHDRLDEPLDLNQLALVADLSPYHWHRVYHALMGETVAATVRRVRLHRASGYLAQSTLTVSEIARRCGYPNAQSFARAFRQFFGQSPQAWRQTRTDALPWQTAEADQPDAWPVTVRHVPAIPAAGIAHRGSYMRIGRAFETAQIHFAAQGLMRPDTRWLAQYLDDPFAFAQAQLNSRAGFSLPPVLTSRLRCSASAWAARPAPCCATAAPTPTCVRPTAGCTAPGSSQRVMRWPTSRCSRSTSTTRVTPHPPTC